MNPAQDLLHPYPFERLRSLFAGAKPPTSLPHINMGIGEPQHPTPPLILDALMRNFGMLAKYPMSQGSPELRSAISQWLLRRFGVTVDSDRRILPVSGSREALFAIAQAVVNPMAMNGNGKPVVLLPNPFYQIYEGAAIMAGAEPIYVPTSAEAGFKPDWSTVPADVWPRVQLVYVCTPGNPAGACLTESDFRWLANQADTFGFLVVSDEPYSELYNGEPPYGSIQLQHENFITVNSLSKRSSAPGLRSGFIAASPAVTEKILLYRTYHGAAPSLMVQAASAAAWQDEAHVVENRRLYREKFAACQPILNAVLPCHMPEGGFFLWAQVPKESRWHGSDEAFARELYERVNVTVLPGSYLARDFRGENPGAGYVRVALVADVATCKRAVEAIVTLS
jgi:N-succinyldiaminopimelate aminotransferase